MGFTLEFASSHLLLHGGQDENRRSEEKEWMGHKYLLHHFYFEDDGKEYVIWALTAGILIKAASIVYQRQPAFVERRPKFWSGSTHETTP